MRNKEQSSVDKEFIPLEEALALKKLGFDQPCFKYIYIGSLAINEDLYLEVEPSKARNYNVDNLSISQPTFSQAFRWFRDTHNLIGGIQYIGGLKSETTWWDIYVVGHFNTCIYEMSMEYQPYEEAELACLKKLIEIVQGGNK